MHDPEGVQGGKRVTDVTLPMNRELAQGTVPILRQQRDWVGGVKKLTIFDDNQYQSLLYGRVT